VRRQGFGARSSNSSLASVTGRETMASGILTHVVCE